MPLGLGPFFHISVELLTHIIAALNHEAHGYVTVPRDRPETNVGGDDAVRHAVGHGSVAVGVSRKRQRFATRVTNGAPG